MNDSKLNTLPKPPSLLKTIVAGFDNITNHIALILFPIGLDLLIWFTPRLRLVKIINTFFGDVVQESLLLAPDFQSEEILKSAGELWTLAGERLNILIALRSYPVGIPSLMSSILPLDNPVRTPTFIDFDSLVVVFILTIIFILIGLILGTLYFSCVSQAVINNAVNWRQLFKDWPRLSVQVIFLSLIWLLIFVGLSIPASCIATLAALGSLALGQCVFLMFLGFFIWVVFPLLFSPHGIFINRKNAWVSLKHGVMLTRMTLPTTGLLFLGILLLVQGSYFLWRIAPEDSWLMFLSIAGHAFVTTSLLSASFIYYRDADNWIQNLQNEKIKENPVNSTQ